MAVARKKTILYLDRELVHATKELASRTGRQDYEVVEDALRRYLDASDALRGRQALEELLDELGGRAAPSDDEGLRLAYAELHAARRERG
jgi:hypothetical protein